MSDELCVNCKYYEKFAGVCCNRDSENCADFTDENDYCGYFERRADNAE